MSVIHKAATAVALAAALGVATAGTANATDYSGYTLAQLSSMCLSHGSQWWPWRGTSGQVKVPTTQVELGSIGDCVAYAQDLLQWNGHPEVGVDGQFGPVTNSAVRAYQSMMASAGYCGGVDGQVGPRTFMCLETGN